MHQTVLYVLLSLLGWQEPPVTPAPTPVPMVKVEPTIIGPKSTDPIPEGEPVPDGTRESPYVFNLGDKGKLLLGPQAPVVPADAKSGFTKVTWTIKYCPVDTEKLPSDAGIWFPTNKPGLYLVSVAGLTGTATEPVIFNLLAWFEIKGPNGPPIPLPPDDLLTQRIKAAFVGQPPATLKADADTLAAAVQATLNAIESKQVTTKFKAYDSFGAALASASWQVNRYPEVSKIADELFGGKLAGGPVGDMEITAERLPVIAAQLRAVIKGCRSVK